jgi:lipopolysaccharide heptosyltransferase II
MRAILKRKYLIVRGICLHLLGHIIPQTSGTLPDIRQMKKVLIVRIDRIGDMVLSTPVFKSLKAANPQLEITILASPANSAILDNNPSVDHIVEYNPAKGLRGLLDVIKQLRKSSLDLAIDSYDNYKLVSALIVFLGGAKWRVGYPSYGREIFFNIKVARPPGEAHFIDVVMNTLKPLGVAINDRVPEIFITQDERKKGGEWLAQMGIENKPVIGVHPGAYYESQRWPIEYYAELITLLQKNKNLEVVIFGGPGDSSILDQIQLQLNGKVLTYEHNDMRHFLALVSKCSLFICNNSGPLHMACALGVPTISFMGPTVKGRWMPVGDQHKIFRIDDLSCIGCGAGTCIIKTHDCMRRITPNYVMDLIEKTNSFILSARI